MSSFHVYSCIHVCVHTCTCSLWKANIIWIFVLCSVTKERDEIFDNYLEQVHMQIHAHTNIYTLSSTHTHTCTKSIHMYTQKHNNIIMHMHKRGLTQYRTCPPTHSIHYYHSRTYNHYVFYLLCDMIKHYCSRSPSTASLVRSYTIYSWGNRQRLCSWRKRRNREWSKCELGRETEVCDKREREREREMGQRKGRELEKDG